MNVITRIEIELTYHLLQFIQLRIRMEKYLKPERLELDPSKPEAANTWRHWKMTFNIFLEAVCETQQLTSMTDRLKLKLLINLLSQAIFKHISDSHDYSGARGVMVIVVGIGHDDTSSNPGRD